MPSSPPAASAEEGGAALSSQRDSNSSSEEGETPEATMETMADAEAARAPEETKEDENNDSSSNNNNISYKPETVSYSTRGRASLQEENALDRLAIAGDLLSSAGTGSTKDLLQAVHHALPPPPTIAAMRLSFLSDSLTEEERRTRTRYLPQVEGMHVLRKQEVKGDLALSRSNLPSSSSASSGAAEKQLPSVRSKRKPQRSDDDGDQNEGGDALSEEDRMSDVLLRNQAVTFEIGTTKLAVPSAAFVAPPSDIAAAAGGGSKPRSSPREVEAVSAFNPPRPPESVGAKKKHRILRWERRPADIDVDLANYKKTVQRTREELRNAEHELQRVETVDNHLRRHFLYHLSCLNEELGHLGDEIASVQQECVDAADLPACRTRRRGASSAYGSVNKTGSTVMRDVLASLRAKGAELEARGIILDGTGGGDTTTAVQKKIKGAGGVTAVSCQDWNRSTKIEAAGFAEAWIVPGDTVDTPCGQGKVVAVCAPGTLSASEEIFEKKKTGAPVLVEAAPNVADAMEVDSPPKPGSASVSVSEAGKKKAPKSKKKDASEVSFENWWGPRIAVRLPFGVGFFNLESVTSKEDPSKYSDKRLVERWKAIAETAKAFGGIVDIAAMANCSSRDSSESFENLMEVDVAQEGGANEGRNSGNSNIRRLVPFGSSMFPTAVGRGTNLYRASMAELDKAIDTAFYKSAGILGSPDNPGVPAAVRALEDQQEQHLVLQAKALQLRNQLYHQRRIRILNEKTYASTQERASRVESLVSEMRTDLKSLKGRLDVEIRDLGISEEQAEGILTSFYMSLDSQHLGEASPPKRHRRLSRMNEETDSDEDMDDAEDAAATEAGKAEDAVAALAGLASEAAALPEAADNPTLQ